MIGLNGFLLKIEYTVLLVGTATMEIVIEWATNTNTNHIQYKYSCTLIPISPRNTLVTRVVYASAYKYSTLIHGTYSTV